MIPESGAPDEVGTTGVLVAGRPWPEIVHEVFDWADELFIHPPAPITRTDAVYMGGMVLTWAALARHAKNGALTEATAMTCLRLCVLSMANLRTHEERTSAQASEIWRRLGDWFTEMFPPKSGPRSQRAQAVIGELDAAMSRILRGVIWEGDPLKGYVGAAKRPGRGGWKGLMKLARGDGVVGPGIEEADRHILMALEARRLSCGVGMSRSEDGRISPSFGGAIDSWRKEVKPAKPVDPTEFEIEELVDLAAAERRERRNLDLLRLQGLVESFSRRRGRSQYARIVAEHAWRLFVHRDPATLARELGVHERPLRREWDRHLARLTADRSIGPQLRKMASGM